MLDRLPLRPPSPPISGLRPSGPHDANIVATMLENGIIARLLTFNAADFRRFAQIIDIRSSPP